MKKSRLVKRNVWYFLKKKTLNRMIFSKLVSLQIEIIYIIISNIVINIRACILFYFFLYCRLGFNILFSGQINI